MKQPHHMCGREGAWLNKQLFWLPVCAAHHRKIHHEETGWAYEEGYLILRK